MKELRKNFSIATQAQGPGIWHRLKVLPEDQLEESHLKEMTKSQLYLRNLYSTEAELSRVEIQRPMPHPLYMNEGRDEEDRPILWARLNKLEKGQEIGPKIYFVSIQLPTLRGEREIPPVTTFSKRQEEIWKTTLALKAAPSNMDELGTEVRKYCLNHIISQTDRIQEYWKSQNQAENKCIFVLAGDFNFEHNPPLLPEYDLLLTNSFFPVKTSGYTRKRIPGYPPRLVDNIWIKGDGIKIKKVQVPVDAAKIQDCPDRSVDHIYLEGDGIKIEEVPVPVHLEKKLDLLSDHYPVVAEITLD